MALSKAKGKLVAGVIMFVGLVLYHGALAVMESLDNDEDLEPKKKRKSKKSSKKKARKKLK
jgi:hypothetical protein